MLTGALAPLQEKGEPASALPLLVNVLRVPEPILPIQILPKPSIAILPGLFRPLPV